MNKKIIHSFLAATILFFSCEKHGKLEWENPTIFEINKLPPKAHFISYETEKLAQINNPLESKNYISLNGNWKFKFSKILKIDRRIFMKWVTTMMDGVK